MDHYTPEARVTGPADAKFLHVFPSFGIGGVPLRMVRIMNYFGPQFRHKIIALDDNFDAARKLAAAVNFELLSISRKQWVLGRFLDHAQTVRRLKPDLLLTYNWGAIEWAMTNRLFRLSRHIHLEAGFGKEEAELQLLRRVMFRRIALRRCAKVVVPSRCLAELARRVWQLPTDLVSYIPNGVDLAQFSSAPMNIGSSFTRRPGEVIIGTVVPLRPEKNVGRLLHAFAAVDAALAARLIIVGDGIERAALVKLANQLGVADRVTFTGYTAPETILGHFDIFALSSDTEQMPNALLEAMAAGRAVAAVDVGDIRTMLCHENGEFVVGRDDQQAFTAAITRLIQEPAKRGELGHKNRERVVAEFSQERMFAAYQQLFASIQVA